MVCPAQNLRKSAETRRGSWSAWTTNQSPPRCRRCRHEPRTRAAITAPARTQSGPWRHCTPNFAKADTSGLLGQARASWRRRADQDAWGISSRRSNGDNEPCGPRGRPVASRSEEAMRTRTITSSPRGRRARPLVLLASSLALVGLLASPAQAGRYVDRAVAGLGHDPVYVDAGARNAIPAASVTALRDRVRKAGTPIYVAVLPAAALREAGGNADRLAQAIVEALRGGGTVAVVAGGRTGAASSRLDPGIAGTTVRAANQAHRGDPAAAMLDFVGRADAAASAGEPFWRTVWDRPLARPIALVVGGLILVTLVDVVVVNMFRRR